MSDEPRRRADDGRVGRLEERMDRFEIALAENTATTKEVRDILGSFKMIGAIAKWGAAVIGFCIAAYHGAQAFFHK